MTVPRKGEVEGRLTSSLPGAEHSRTPPLNLGSLDQIHCISPWQACCTSGLSPLPLARSPHLSVLCPVNNLCLAQYNNYQ